MKCSEKVTLPASVYNLGKATEQNSCDLCGGLGEQSYSIMEVKGTIEVAQVIVLQGHPGPRGRAGQSHTSAGQARVLLLLFDTPRVRMWSKNTAGSPELVQTPA